MMRRGFVASILLGAAIAAHGQASPRASCASDDPVVVARSFYTGHAAFFSEDPAKVRSIVTPRLFAALDREFKCAQGQICALEADPWMDAQDGRIGKPVEFFLAGKSASEARVAMSYPFILDKSHRKQQQATLVLHRDSDVACWLIADLVGPRGDSLLEAIEKWHKEYGSAR